MAKRKRQPAPSLDSVVATVTSLLNAGIESAARRVPTSSKPPSAAPAPRPESVARARRPPPKSRSPKAEQSRRKTLWSLFDAAHYDLRALARTLSALSDEHLMDVILAYEEAIDCLDIEVVHAHVSDDRLEDLGDWIVACGPDAWTRGLKGGKHAMALARELDAYDDGERASPWHVPKQGFMFKGTRIKGDRAFPSMVIAVLAHERFDKSPSALLDEHLEAKDATE
jgi:hypothetical protein